MQLNKKERMPDLGAMKTNNEKKNGLLKAM